MPKLDPINDNNDFHFSTKTVRRLKLDLLIADFWVNFFRNRKLIDRKIKCNKSKYLIPYLHEMLNPLHNPIKAFRHLQSKCVKSGHDGTIRLRCGIIMHSSRSFPTIFKSSSVNTVPFTRPSSRNINLLKCRRMYKEIYRTDICLAI